MISLMKSNLYLSNKVNFTDDVAIDRDNKIEDVTDLIRFFRNGGSHIDSPNRKLGQGTSAFNTFVGLVMNLGLDEHVVQLKYSDDIAYNMGKHVLYLKRHIIRAFEEVKKNLQPYL